MNLPDVPTDEDNLDADTSGGGDEMGGEALGGRPDKNLGRKDNIAKLKEFLDRITNKPGKKIPNGLTEQESRIAFALLNGEISIGGHGDAKEMADKLGIPYGSFRQLMRTLEVKLSRHAALAKEMGIAGLGESKKQDKEPDQTVVTENKEPETKVQEAKEPEAKKEKSFIEEMVEEWIRNPGKSIL